MSIPTYDLASLTYDSATTDYDGGGLGLSNMPVVGVFISFTDGPYVVDPNWVEVTQYVRDINVRRGRGNDLQQFPSGSATLTLDNRARLFDPFNTAGTYYGNLKPRRQIKIVGQWAGVTYPIFRGFIAGWPVAYSDGGKDSTVDIDCFDALGLLAAETTDADPLFTYTMTLSPYHYYRFDETIVPATSPTVTFKDYGSNNYSFTLTGTRIGNAESLAKGIRASSLDTSKQQVISTAPTLITSLTNWSESYWIEYSTVLGTNTIISQNNFYYQYLVQINSSGFMTILIYRSGGTGWLWTTNAVVQQGTNATHIAITWLDAGATQGTISLYINGVQVAVTASVVGAPPFPLFTFDTVNMSASKLQEYARFTYVLTADQILNIYKNGVALFNETTSARFTRLLANTSFSALMQSVTASPAASVTDSNNGQQLLNELNVVQDSEGGELYASSQGILTFVNRDYLASTRSATSNVTFTDTGTGVYYDHASLRMAYDADLVRNEFNISYSGSGQVVSSDATSISSFGSSGESLSTYIDSATNAKTLADRSVTIYKNPKLGVDPFMVKGQRNPSYDWPLLLSLELLDRFTFVRTPSTGSAISQDMLLQSIEHRITPGSWETVVNGSARFTGWFTIGTSLIGGTDVLL
jgi:hypothetical protein